MNRKNTILLAVLVNAGLLVVLLVAAMVGQEEISTPSVIAQEEIKTPLFLEEMSLSMKEPSPREALPQVIPQAPESAPLVHTLPPLAPPEAPVVAVAPVVAAPPAEPSFKQVLVKKGDSLEKIAKVHHTTVEEIIQSNDLSSSFLRVGQTLKISAAKKGASAPPAKKKEISSEQSYYVVKVGDTPWTIAQKHHLKIEELLKLNSLNETKARKLKPGDRLRVK